jgi:hypothetical protein
LDLAIRNSNYDLLFSIDLQMNMAAWEKMADTTRFPDGVGSITTDDLATIFVNHPSTRELSWRVSAGRGHVPRRPFRWSVVKGSTIELRSIVPQPLYIANGIIKKLLSHTPAYLDKFLLESAAIALNGTSRMRILTNCDEFLCATVDCTETDTADRNFRVTQTSDIMKTTYDDLSREGMLNEVRNWAIQHSVLIGPDQSRTILNDIADNFSMQSPGSSREFMDFFRFSRDVTVPAFDEIQGRPD